MLSDLGYDLRRKCQCKSCKNPIPDTAPLHKRYCQALCQANAWSRANRQFSSAFTVSDFENVREEIKQFEVRLKVRVLGYALIKAHPQYEVVSKIGKSTFPPTGRKTKRSDETGKVCFSSAPFFSFAPWFEWPRVPLVGLYQVVVWCEGKPTPIVTGLHVEVRKALPAVHFHDDKTGQRYTLKGDLIQPKPPKPPKPPTERKKRKPATATEPQPEQAPERAPSPDRVPERVPAVAAQRAPDAELVARVKKLEEERAGQTKERADLLATIEKERKEHAATRRDFELLRATVPRTPARDDSSTRLQAAEKRALDQRLQEFEKSVGQLGERVAEQEKKIAKLETERDDLAKQVKTVSSQRDELQVERTTLARQVLKLEDERKETVAQAERERTELATKLTEAVRQRDELAAKPAHQTAPAATAEVVMAAEGADSTPPTSPTGIVIPRLALGGNLPLASSPKTGPPSLGILSQNNRPPIRGSANRKHKGR